MLESSEKFETISLLFVWHSFYFENWCENLNYSIQLIKHWFARNFIDSINCLNSIVWLWNASCKKKHIAADKLSRKSQIDEKRKKTACEIDINVFRQISLGDWSHEVANRYVVNYLDADFKDDVGNEGKLLLFQPREDLSELTQCIEILRGRFTDLEFLARRIKTGETPNSKHAVELFQCKMLFIHV